MTSKGYCSLGAYVEKVELRAIRPLIEQVWKPQLTVLALAFGVA
jgi:hypothetical protein